MEASDRPSQDRRSDDGSNTLDALSGRPELRQTSQSRARVKTTWLERYRDSDYARAIRPQRFPASKDLRKWDWRKLGYADKPSPPRDYSKAISPELQRFYGEREN